MLGEEEEQLTSFYKLKKNFERTSRYLLYPVKCESNCTAIKPPDWLNIAPAPSFNIFARQVLQFYVFPMMMQAEKY